MKLVNEKHKFECVRIKKFPKFTRWYLGNTCIQIDGIEHVVMYHYNRDARYFPTSAYLNYSAEKWLIKEFLSDYNNEFSVEGYKPKQVRKVYKKVNKSDRLEINCGLCEVPTGERNNCVPRAISIGFNIPYLEAYEILARAGRKHNKGFRTADLFKPDFRLNGKKAVEISYQNLTVNKFLSEHPQGTYILRIREHAFAVVNGKAQDKDIKLKAKVLTAWAIEEV